MLLYLPTEISFSSSAWEDKRSFSVWHKVSYGFGGDNSWKIREIPFFSWAEIANVKRAQKINVYFLLELLHDIEKMVCDYIECFQTDC